jgi:hypothetical protein
MVFFEISFLRHANYDTINDINSDDFIFFLWSSLFSLKKVAKITIFWQQIVVSDSKILKK